MEKNNKNKRNKKNTKKIFIAILMILFTGIILTSSTYAWFTANKTVTVDQIDVQVAAENGLQLSVDGTNWKPVITNDDINNAITSGPYPTAVNQLPKASSAIVPTSTIGEVDPATGFMKMYAGAIETEGTDYIVTANKSTEINTSDSGDFIAFDLFFKTTTDTPIYLTNTSKVLNISGPKGLQNAARVAFVPQGNTTSGDTLANIQALKAADSSELKIWEPNYDVHTPSGVKNAKDNYNKDTTETGAARLPYYGVKAPIANSDKQPLDSTNASFFGPVTPTITSVEAGIPDTAYAKAFDLKAGITKIRVYMWIEGQDVDCENDASGSSISFDLQFSMNDKG